MWPFVKDVKLLPLLAAEAGFFEHSKLAEVTHTFERIAHRAGTSACHGNVLSSEWLNLFRVLVNKKFVATHVMASIANFRDFEALSSYEMKEDDWDRFLLRDASLFFIIALQETLACYRINFDLSQLISELLMKAKNSRLFKVFKQFFSTSNPCSLVEELSYSTLFYLSMMETSKYQWKRWNAYKDLPDGAIDILNNDSTDARSVKEKNAVIARLTSTNCINVFFLRKKIHTLDSEQQREVRRRFEFTLCVLDSDNNDHFKSFIRTLARWPNDCDHSDRVKLWLEKRIQFDPCLEQVDWDDDGQWESVDEDEEPTVVKTNHIILWNIIAKKMTQRRFSEAINLVEKIDTSKESGDNKQLRNAIWAYAASQSSDRDLIKRGQKLLAELDPNTYPIANYWLAESLYQHCDYANASRFVEDAQFQLIAIPCTQEYLKPSNETEFNARLNLLKMRLQSPPKAQYVCCRQDCDSREIFENDLNFNGLVRATCESDCCLNFHADCWKIVVRNFLTADNKHKLGSLCYTPDCAGRINLIKIFNSNMLSTKEYRWRSNCSEKNNSAAAAAAAAAASASNIDDAMLEALRVTISHIKGDLSESEIISFCEEFSKCDSEIISSFVKSCLEDEQTAHPEWTRAHWLQAIHDLLETIDGDFINDVNKGLNTTVIVERITQDEIDCIEAQYAQLESEFTALLSEEVGLRNQLHTSHKLDAENEAAQLQTEIRALENRLASASDAGEAIKTLQRKVDFKKQLLTEFDNRIANLKIELSELEAQLRNESLKYHRVQNERSSLLGTVKANADEMRASLRRALMELNETRYAIASDNLRAVEQAIGKNLRALEKLCDPEIKKLNATAQQEHFKALHEVVAKARKLEKSTKLTTVQIQNGRLDTAAVGICPDELPGLLQMYSDLPEMFVAIERPTLRRVAESFEQC